MSRSTPLPLLARVMLAFTVLATSMSSPAATADVAGGGDVIGVTGATGQLGRLTIDELLRMVPASRIVAVVRDPARATDLAAKGVTVRRGDYDDPHSLLEAFDGIDRLLLISSLPSAPGQRLAQHEAVIAAAKARGVGFVAYTSLLHADTTPLALRADHAATERLLTDSGISHAVLRNGWYTENYAADVASAVRTGEIVAASGDGRISAAARADYAAAAAAVLTAGDDQSGRIYELAGDSAFTLAELAAEVSRQVGRPVTYRNLSEAQFRSELIGHGQPEAVAAFVADMHTGISRDALHDDGGQLSRLIGRPTTPWQQTVAESVTAAGEQD